MTNPGRLDEQIVRDLRAKISEVQFLLEATLSDYSATSIRTHIRALHRIVDADVLVMGW